ncbi:MFS transporter [Sphingobium rhizovicinum]|uniref:MFS transporter n=1 Tax=Sphingobium rhizovicinum TaxID=432308 RepID=A0ABV7NM91_9SPHN
MSGAVTAMLSGMGIDGYALAVRPLLQLMNGKQHESVDAIAEATKGAAGRTGADQRRYPAQLHGPRSDGRGRAVADAELKISPEMMGFIFSAFSWTYAASQIPGGLLLDRLGTRITYAGSLILWSFFTLLHGIAGNVAMLFGFRWRWGWRKQPCYPCNSRILSRWFPQDERARPIRSMPWGNMRGWPFSRQCCSGWWASFGWRALFLIAGALGMAFAC